MRRFSRQEILAGFRKQIKEGIPIIGAGAGCGLSAACEEDGGADMIIIYNSGKFRMAGRGSASGRFAYSDANAVVLDLAAEVLNAVDHTPVLAGVLGLDPFRDMHEHLLKLKEAGFAGVQNFPTVGVVGFGDTVIGRNVDAAGCGYSAEVDMVREAASLDMLTTPYCFDPEQAAAMTKAGADIIVAHMGLTLKGLIGADNATGIDLCVEKIREIACTAKDIDPDVLVICHGGPIAAPEDVRYVFERVPEVTGFYGASSAERLPVENAVMNTVRSLKAITC